MILSIPLFCNRARTMATAYLAVLSVVALAAGPATAQIDTSRLGSDPVRPPVDQDLPDAHRPSGLRIVDVGEFETYFTSAAGDSMVTLIFDVEVANSGDTKGRFLITGKVPGASELLTSKPQYVTSGETLVVPVRFTTEFNCRGDDKFPITLVLVDRWNGLDRRGIPLVEREVDQAVRWIDASRTKQGKPVGQTNCEGGDPFAGGVVMETDLAAPVMTPFKPDVHGFNFRNNFRNNWIPALDAQTSGLCGGMMYTALDYYYAGRQIPQQDYRPADHTVLYRYLWDRQQTSIEANLDHWFELRQNPGGVRNTTIFNWGLGERLADLREYIDRGEPALLGLKGANGSGDHQVLAVGYFLGRYRGDSGDYKEDTKIFVYDPNFPDELMTLIPHLERQFYYYAEKADEVIPDDARSDDDKVGKYYQAYFVDRNYHRNTPPDIANPVYPDDGLVYELIVSIETGGDDLRGGSQVDAVIETRDGRTQSIRDINGSRRWIEDYTQHVQVVLDEPTRFGNLKELRLSFRSGGTGTHDNWDVRKMWISARGHGKRPAYDQKSSPLIRFTGQRREFTAYLDTAAASDSHIRKIDLTLETGGDDLRGGNDNVDAHVLFADGTEQLVPVINNFHPLRNNTSLTYPLVLEEPRPASEIRGVRLVKSRGTDNWNLDGLRADLVPVRGETRSVPFAGLRFTTSRRSQDFLFE